MIHENRNAGAVPSLSHFCNTAVVAGHGVLDPDSSPRHVEEIGRYIRDFNGTAASTSTATELYEKMLSLYPSPVNPGSLWAAAKAVKGSAKASAE